MQLDLSNGRAAVAQLYFDSKKLLFLVLPHHNSLRVCVRNQRWLAYQSPASVADHFEALIKYRATHSIRHESSSCSATQWSGTRAEMSRKTLLLALVSCCWGGTRLKWRPVRARAWLARLLIAWGDIGVGFCASEAYQAGYCARSRGSWIGLQTIWTLGASLI